MNDPVTKFELQRLLAAWCNDALDGEDAERLQRALETDPEARRFYLQYAAVEAELRSVHSGGAWAGAQLAEAAMQDEPSLAPTAGVAPRREPAERSRSRGRRGRHGATVAIAASLIGIAAIASWVAYRVGPSYGRDAFVAAATPGEDRAADGANAPDGPALARVTATRNCRWSGPSATIGFGAELSAGQRVELAAGLAELTFENGARVLLEGPAKLDLAADTESVLLAGRLAATLPAGVEVTPVRTPRMGVVIAPAAGAALTSGWHFGLAADASDGDELHVFRGRIDAYLMAEDAAVSEPRRVQLKAREAARIRPASTTVAKFYAQRDQFVRTISSTGGPQDGLYAYEGFDYPAGPLANQNGGFGWAGAWADIEAACPPGRLATNVVGDGGLPHPGLRAVGGHAVQVAQQNRIRRALGTSLGGVFDSAELVENQDGHRLVGANGRVVYLSFLQQVDKTDDGFYGFELHRGDGNPNRVLCIGNGAEGAGYGVTSNFNSYGKSNYARLGQENGEINLVVVKIEFGPEHRDRVTVYRNPESLLEEQAAEATVRLRGNFAFDRVSLGCFDGTKQHYVDELRVGTTYRAVTGHRDRGSETLGVRLALVGRRPDASAPAEPLRWPLGLGAAIVPAY